MKIAVAKGDGIGPEIMDAVLNIFKANQVPLEYVIVDMGKWVFDKGFSNGMTPESQQVIEELGILFKGPMETPKGKGVKSINVRQEKHGILMPIKEFFNHCMVWIPFSPKPASRSISPSSVKTLKILMAESNICPRMMLL